MAALRRGAIFARCSSSNSSIDTIAPQIRRSSGEVLLQRLWHDQAFGIGAPSAKICGFEKSHQVVEFKLEPHQLWRWRASSHSSTSSSRNAPGNGRRRPATSSSSSSPRVPQENLRRGGTSSSSPGEEKQHIERFFATCAPGLEEIVAAELRSAAIGATRVQVGSAGVSFQGTKRIGVLANLWLRSATRVLLELASGPLARERTTSKDPVYEFVRRAADWPALLSEDSLAPSPGKSGGRGFQSEEQNEIPSRKPQSERSGRDSDTIRTSEGRNQRQGWKFRTFSVSSRVWDCEGVTSSMFAATRAKDAICDVVKDACGGSRPDPPEEGGASADVPLFLALYRDHALLYRDMTGISLHKRGYRDVMHKAGLNEAIAAAMLSLAGWNRWLPEFESSSKGPGQNSGVLMDPMCGSGTFLIEAALMALNSAPGLMRSRWPFESWHDFHPSLLKSCREDAIAAEISAPRGLRLLGNDIHEGALSLCKRDAEAANVRSMLELSCRDCRDYSPPVTPSLVFVNPPWGARLGDTSDIDDEQSLLTTWQALGRFLKTHCSEADVYVLSGNSTVTHAMHMKADRKWPVSVGGIDCRIMHYHVLPPKNSRTTESTVKVPHLT